MSKTDFSKKLKSAIVRTPLYTSLKSVSFPIGLARNEVIFLHSSKLIYYRDVAAPYNAKAFLYRKTENVPTDTPYSDHSTGAWGVDKAVIDAWFVVGRTISTAESLNTFPILFETYSKPIVLIRPPSMLYYGTTNASISLTLWYHTEKVSDKDLLELMVKDHA